MQKPGQLLICKSLFDAVQALGNFSLYDYREPQAVPEELKGAFNVVVADPPYLVSSSTLCHSSKHLLT